MALSDKEQYTVIRLLGWPAKTLVVGSTHYNSLIAARLSGLPAEVESDVRLLIERLEKLDEKLEGALCRASTKKVDNLELNPLEMEVLRGERRRVLREISDLLDIPLMASGGVNISVCV